MDKDTCQALYMNLLALRVADAPRIQWFREFEETARCDAFHSFKECREEYRGHAGAFAVDRVLSYDATRHTNDRVEQAVIHLADRHCQELARSLTWWNTIRYQFFYKHKRERLLNWLGLAASMGIAWLIVRHRVHARARRCE